MQGLVAACCGDLSNIGIAVIAADISRIYLDNLVSEENADVSSGS
jgi:hypothetical protein